MCAKTRMMLEMLDDVSKEMRLTRGDQLVVDDASVQLELGNVGAARQILKENNFFIQFDNVVVQQR